MRKSTGCGWRLLGLTAAFGAALALSACGSSSSGSVDGDTDTEAVSEADGDSDGEAVSEAACFPYENVPQDTPDATRTQFALSMFHFNLQYVPGGLETTVDGQTVYAYGDDCAGWTDEKLNDWIITTSFEPVLDLYLKHPTWRATFEMQALMLEQIAERHPAILAKLRTAAQAGQIELVSFHYSDQFFLGFPKDEMVDSVERTRRVFNDACVPLSKVVFNQEGQSGEGKHAFMADHDYAISVFPANLFKYFRGQDFVRWPLYTDHGVDVVIGPGAVDPSTGIDVNWTFFDDGELLATPNGPYFVWADPDVHTDSLSEYEAKLTNLESQGYKITSVTDYVAHLKARNIEAKAFPVTLDGTWQPQSVPTNRWMGGRSALASEAKMERDNTERTYNYRVHQKLQAVAALLAKAKADGKTLDAALDTTLDEGWRQLTLAEVSDATGITPWIGEYNYGMTANAAAEQAAQTVAAAVLGAYGAQNALADAVSGITFDPTTPASDPAKAATAPFDVTLDAPSRTSSTTWQQSAADANIYMLTVAFGASGDPTGKDAAKARVELTFPRYDAVARYTPALLDGQVVSRDMNDFTLPDLSADNHEVFLPLQNGLFGLGNDWWVIKDCSTIHLALHLPHDSTDLHVSFIDETADPEKGDTWRLVFFHGSEADALTLAGRLNSAPALWVAADGSMRNIWFDDFTTSAR